MRRKRLRKPTSRKQLWKTARRKRPRMSRQLVEVSEEAEGQEERPADEGEDTQEAEADPKAEDEGQQEEDKQDE